VEWGYVAVEAAVCAAWAIAAWQKLGPLFARLAAYVQLRPSAVFADLEIVIGSGVFCSLLIGLAVLDAQYMWLPDIVTLPGIALGIAYSISLILGSIRYITVQPPIWQTVTEYLIGVVVAAGLILLIRWIYKLIRHREGLGLGDAKLMAMLAAWLGLPGALLSFAIGVVLGSLTAIVMLVRRNKNEGSESWAGMKLPLGTFLCIGGIVASLWGQPIIAAYLRWARF
jgi:leader peptidase (prepilin peptidase)/N-methyltransferase